MSTRECADALALALELCECLGVPVSSHKVEGPAMVLTFLGILLDTWKLEIKGWLRVRLPVGAWENQVSR